LEVFERIIFYQEQDADLQKNPIKVDV